MGCGMADCCVAVGMGEAHRQLSRRYRQAGIRQVENALTLRAAQG